MKISVPVCIVSLGLCFAILARAEVPAPPPSVNEGKLEVARGAFQRGVDLFREGNFQAALAEFQKANQAAPSYRILYNIGQAYFELHDYVNAVKFYQQFLTEGDKAVPAARRTQVEESIQKLQTRIGTLDIQVNQDDAQVSVDDVVIGASPLPYPVKVNPGARRVSATKEGFAGTVRTVTVAGSDQLAVVLELGDPATTGQGLRPLGVGEKASQGDGKAGGASRVPLVVALAATGVSAATAVLFGVLANSAKSDLDKDLNTFAISPAQVDDDRSTLRRYALLSDVATATTLVAGGVSLYLALTRPSGQEKRSSETPRKLALVPTLGGVTLLGGW
jgi:hypothetical protein